MLKIIFSMSLSFLVILYSIWHRVWHRMSSQNYIYFGSVFQSLWKTLILKKMWLFFLILDGCVQPCSSVNVPNAYIRWTKTPLRVSWPIRKYSYYYGHCTTMVLCHISPFCSSIPKISERYLILKIIFSMTKCFIKHPIVYFLSSVSVDFQEFQWNLCLRTHYN